MMWVRALALGVGLLFASAAGADDAKSAGKIDPAKLVGSWKITSAVIAGKKVNEDAIKGLVTITRDRIHLSGQSPDEKFDIAYKVGASAQPATIDMEILKPEPMKGTKAKGIIKLEKGVLTLCYNPTNGPRPAKFESSAKNNLHLITLKKVQTTGKKKAEK